MILVDTKYEFAWDEDGELLLIDEIHTPDSSRYWIADSYQARYDAGQEPENIDEQAMLDNDGLQPAVLDSDNSAASSDDLDLVRESLQAPVAAGLLLAARVSRKRGWHVGWFGDGQQQVQGDLDDLRKQQSERQFKVWRKH